MPKKVLTTSTFTLDSNFITKALYWSQQFVYACYLNPNHINNYPSGPFIHALAVSNTSKLNTASEIGLDRIQERLENSSDWLFGHLSYDLKNSIENLSSDNNSFIKFPSVSFFKADYLLLFTNDSVEIQSFKNKTASEIREEIFDTEINLSPSEIGEYKKGIKKSKYLENVERLIQHIEEGDIYEINYCFNYLIKYLNIDPVSFYIELTKKSPTPFSSYYKNKNLYALGCSPERFLKKEKDQLISQPIKGTIKRGTSQSEDDLNKVKLRNDEKELAENMMIVDLVRNDLARSSVPGSVKVEEMFGIYSFKHWHQMISTVSSRIRKNITLLEIIKNAFPMGSMTGAPKIKVMELIEKYENFKRGIYSGAIGYISPQNDFDFNVVIRTLLYDHENKKGEFMVGSAITYDSIPEKEFQECELKAKAIIETLIQLAQ